MSDQHQSEFGFAEEFLPSPLEDGVLNPDELELAYLRALETLEVTEALPGMDLPAEENSVIAPENRVGWGWDSSAGTIPGNRMEKNLPTVSETSDSATESINPIQVIESVLFVGGDPLTAKKIAGLFDAHVEPFLIESQIDILNEEYRLQNRPYEIRLGEGGYRMTLRPEFESIRNKVYGIGPREVRLSQDALEMLAFVAYQQPVSHQQILETGKKNSSNLVRQLIRRELVSIERGDAGPRSVAYRTTHRFLKLFGLSSIEELPQVDELTLR